MAAGAGLTPVRLFCDPARKTCQSLSYCADMTGIFDGYKGSDEIYGDPRLP
ncbi:MAG: hypothetical protein ACI9BD_001332 [Candidatus Marinamargulisbacteria bacterium]|jgi:hypothetical protein